MITLYLYENIIQYMEKEEIKEYIINENAMSYGKIKNIPQFEEALIELIKKEKWSTLFYSKKIRIIIPIHYEEIDKEILTTLLLNNGIKHITYKKESSLLELKNNQVILNLHQNYLTMLKKTRGKTEKLFFPTNIFQTPENMIKYIIENNSKKYRYYFIGSNKNISKIVNNLNDNRLFYYCNNHVYLMKKLIP